MTTTNEHRDNTPAPGDDAENFGFTATVTAAAPTPNTIAISPAHPGPPLVTIHPDGTLQYGPDYTPDEAARAFWEAMAAHGQAVAVQPDGEIAQLRATIERVRRVAEFSGSTAEDFRAALDGDQP